MVSIYIRYLLTLMLLFQIGETTCVVYKQPISSLEAVGADS